MSTPLDHPRLEELIATCGADHPELAAAAAGELTALEGMANDLLALVVRSLGLLARTRGYAEMRLELKFIRHARATLKKHGFTDTPPL